MELISFLMIVWIVCMTWKDIVYLLFRSKSQRLQTKQLRSEYKKRKNTFRKSLHKLIDKTHDEHMDRLMCKLKRTE